MMKTILFPISFLFIFLLASCSSQSTEKNKPENAELNPVSEEVGAPGTLDSTITSSREPQDVSDYSDYYVVVADTGTDYYSLRKRMMEIHKGLDIPVDTMDRYYNSAKGRIVLNENDEDELYRGEYFPRRFPSKSLSLEYMSVYSENTFKKTIVLVRGIYESEKEATNALTELKALEKTAFSIKSRIFTGCLH